jgi:hypothetical protein
MFGCPFSYPSFRSSLAAKKKAIASSGDGPEFHFYDWLGRHHPHAFPRMATGLIRTTTPKIWSEQISGKLWRLVMAMQSISIAMKGTRMQS